MSRDEWVHEIQNLRQTVIEIDSRLHRLLDTLEPQDGDLDPCAEMDELGEH